MKKSLGHIGHVVKSFLDRHWDERRSLLIAYSGGPDSKALLYAALDWGRAPIHIAHVDHGWRMESQNEAAALQNEARLLGCPFHTIRLEKKTTEEEARECRFAFFRSLSEKISFQAVLLGHQSDDLAETVLKRVLEGAHPSQLGGMKEVSSMGDLVLWRPLLSIPRSEIEAYLQERKVSALYDQSNEDVHYLRARMRSQLLPMLKDVFGKGVSKNLSALSGRMHEMGDFLSHRVGQLLDRCVLGPFGWRVDGHNLHRVERRCLLQQMAQNEKFTISRSVLETILDWMDSASKMRQISVNNRSIIVDRGQFFLLAKRQPRFDTDIRLDGGVRWRSGDWIVEETHEEGPCHWTDLWRGGPVVQRMDVDSLLGLAPPDVKNTAKAPAFLKKICPILMKGPKMAGDVLSGKRARGERLVKIFIAIDDTLHQEDAVKWARDCVSVE
ncbi:MAG: tilS [Parachlamydiales bacterium]|nr:tilS [Parachlamydiales bacterium]